jgi:predicted metalloprotease with PDZ domain
LIVFVDDQHIYVNHSLPSSLLTGARVCVLETSPNCSAGFTISGREPAPFAICKIEKDSPADKAGLQLNDSLISINGRSVTGTNYEQTIQIIKEELGQKTIQFIVNQVPMSKDIRNHSSTSDSDGTQGIDGTKQRQDSSERGGNAVHAYQSM